MKNRGKAHALLLWVLLVLLTLFLSVFVVTCFYQFPTLPAYAETVEQVIHVQMPVPLPQQDSIVFEEPAVEEVVLVVEPEPVLLIEEHLPAQSEEEPIIFVEEEPEPEEPVVFEPLVIEPLIPPPPYMYEPLILTEDEYNMFYAMPVESLVSEDDFWADFVVVGQDAQITYEDGFYFLNLYVNDERVGDIEVEFRGEEKLLNAEELAYYVGGFITRSAYERIFGDNPDALSLEQLEERGVQARYDLNAFAIYLTFSIEDMPERIVSVTSTSAISRREQYSMSGAITLRPAKVAIASSLSLYSNLDYPSDFSKLNNSLVSLSVSNRISLFGVGLNYYFSLSSRTPVFTPGNWSGFYDFVESNHRLSFGNVGSSLAQMGGTTNFGFTFEKNYAYGTGSAKGNQFEHRIVLVEASTVEIDINGLTVFTKKFQAGSYRLRDFVFTQGANQILIRIIPDAHPDDTHVEYVDLGYDYRLLGRGDSLYGFGFSVPKEKSATQIGTINLPWFDNNYLAFHLNRFTATYYQQTGITDIFTLTTEVAFSPGLFSGTVNAVIATLVGTSQVQITLGLNETMRTPSFSTGLSHRVSGRQDSKFGTLSATFNYSIPALAYGAQFSSTSVLTLSYSGSFTERIRYTLTGNIVYDSMNQRPTWSLSFSSGFSPVRGLSISGSITAGTNNTNPTKPIFSAQINGSYSFSPKVSSNISTSIQGGSGTTTTMGAVSSSLSWRPSSNDSVNLSLSSFRFSDPLNHSLLATWSHAGELSSFTLRQQISNSYNNMSTTFTANTSLAFADGSFAIGRAVNEAFLLIRPVGDLRKSKVSVARSLENSPTYLARPLGSALYNNITTNMKNSVVVFSSGVTEYSTGSSFVFELTPRSRQSFVALLDVEPAFTISGILKTVDGTPYVQYSSPVYRSSVDEQGAETLVRDDALYLFTDQDGRYILSEVHSGDYVFDLQVEDLWYAIRFTIPEMDSKEIGLDRVLLLEDFWVSDPAFEHRLIIQDAHTGLQVDEQSDVFGTELAVGYDAEVTLDIIDRMSEESFWNIIFPPFDESDFNFDLFDQDFVTEQDFYFDEQVFDSLVTPMEQDYSATELVTAAP